MHVGEVLQPLNYQHLSKAVLRSGQCEQALALRHQHHDRRKTSRRLQLTLQQRPLTPRPIMAMSIPDTLQVRGDQSVQGRKLTVHYLRTDSDLQVLLFKLRLKFCVKSAKDICQHSLCTRSTWFVGLIRLTR